MAIIYDLSKLPKKVQDQIRNTPKFTKWFSEFPKQLFNKDANPKTVKGQKYGTLTYILYMSSHKESGVNLCAMADIAGCVEPCLKNQGRGKMTSTQMSRLRKTLFYLQFFAEFMAMFKKELRLGLARSKRLGYNFAVRPNGTTDIRWELRIWDYMVEMYKQGLQWYDYTKIPNRLVPCSKVYDLTFSYSGKKEYLPFVDKAIKLGMRIAVVFRYKDIIPKTFLGMQVVDGDDHDLRYTEPMGVVSALYAKGDAVHNDNGFVVGERRVA